MAALVSGHIPPKSRRVLHLAPLQSKVTFLLCGLALTTCPRQEQTSHPRPCSMHTWFMMLLRSGHLTNDWFFSLGACFWEKGQIWVASYAKEINSRWLKGLKLQWITEWGGVKVRVRYQDIEHWSVVWCWRLLEGRCEFLLFTKTGEWENAERGWWDLAFSANSSRWLSSLCDAV